MAPKGNLSASSLLAAWRRQPSPLSLNATVHHIYVHFIALGILWTTTQTTPSFIEFLKGIEIKQNQKNPKTLLLHHQGKTKAKATTTVFCEPRSKKAVDQAKWVQRRITVKCSHFPLEPICFLETSLSFNKSLIPLITHHRPTTHGLQLKQTHTHSYTLFTFRPSVHTHASIDVLSSSSLNNLFTPTTVFHCSLFQLQTKNKDAKTNWDEFVQIAGKKVTCLPARSSSVSH